LEAERQAYEDVLARMASTSTKPDQHSGPRQGIEYDITKADNTAYVTIESLAALEAFAPHLIENPCASYKHVNMNKDDKHKYVWLLSKGDNHIKATGTIMGGYGGGHMSSCKSRQV
ncbi:MAG: hypothetical protein ACKPKO_24070, partial [Candidatus Fonsibacter sp.]